MYPDHNQRAAVGGGSGPGSAGGEAGQGPPRPPGQRIVFVSGCYDVMHGGHVEFFTKARWDGMGWVVSHDDELGEVEAIEFWDGWGVAGMVAAGVIVE